MFKQFILILVFTILGVLFKDQLVRALDGLVFIHNYIAYWLHVVFSDDKWGRLIQNMVSLLIIPSVVGLLVAAVFWMMKRPAMPHAMAVVWVLWLILLTTMLAQSHIINPNTAKNTKNPTKSSTTTLPFFG